MTTVQSVQHHIDQINDLAEKLSNGLVKMDKDRQILSELSDKYDLDFDTLVDILRILKTYSKSLQEELNACEVDCRDWQGEHIMNNLKKISVNFQKLYRLQMIDTLLQQTSAYVHEVVERVSEEFDEYEDFDDSITECLINDVRENFTTISKYFSKLPYGYLFKEKDK